MGYLGKVYIACALTGAPQEWLEWVANPDSKVKTALRAEGIETLDFLGTTAGTARDVFRFDFQRCVPCADVIVAFGDLASTGMGMELIYATLGYYKRVVIMVEKGAKVTRALPGFAQVCYDRVSYFEYSRTDVASIVDYVHAILDLERHDSFVSADSAEVYAVHLSFLLHWGTYKRLAEDGMKVKVHNGQKRLLVECPARAWTFDEDRALLAAWKGTELQVTKHVEQIFPQPVPV